MLPTEKRDVSGVKENMHFQGKLKREEDKERRGKEEKRGGMKAMSNEASSFLLYFKSIYFSFTEGIKRKEENTMKKEVIERV